MPSLTVAALASLLNAGEAQGDKARIITGAAPLAEATSSDLSFASGKHGLAAAAHSNAGCLIVPHAFALTGSWALIRAEEPRSAFARALQALYPAKQFAHGLHPSAIVSKSAEIAEDCFVGPHVSIGSGTKIASGCVISAGCFLGDDVTVAERTHLHPNVTIYDNVRIGARVIIHAGAVIGADGFGFVLAGDRYQKFPQVGTVHIHDDVEIGACCCIDRAALGMTSIGAGTKLDNLIHVGHNCRLGENIVVAAQTGFSGSIMVGDFAVIGGQVGIGEKARIDAKAVIGGKAGILTSAVVRAGEPVWGIPARPLRQHLKGLANVNRLSELKDEVRQLRQQIQDLEQKLDQE